MDAVPWIGIACSYGSCFNAFLVVFSMKVDPYQTPNSDVLAQSAEPVQKQRNRNQWIAGIASALAIVVMSLIAVALIIQALRLDSEAVNLPARLRAGYASALRSSWVGGVTAIVGAILNAIGLVYVRKNILVLPIALLLISVVGLVLVGIIFKPS